jgi:hypothetical protein
MRKATESDPIEEANRERVPPPYLPPASGFHHSLNRSPPFKILQALRGRCWAYQTLFTG